MFSRLRRKQLTKVLIERVSTEQGEMSINGLDRRDGRDQHEALRRPGEEGI
jgi:hypothetical protein